MPDALRTGYGLRLPNRRSPEPVCFETLWCVERSGFGGMDGAGPILSAGPRFAYPLEDLITSRPDGH